jgi:hypothetical protein
LRHSCAGTGGGTGKRVIEGATRACELSGWKGATALDLFAAAPAEAGDFDAAVKWRPKANVLYADAGDKAKGDRLLKLDQDKKLYREVSN